jgi:hypothetical protein
MFAVIPFGEPDKVAVIPFGEPDKVDVIPLVEKSLFRSIPSHFLGRFHA